MDLPVEGVEGWPARQSTVDTDSTVQQVVHDSRAGHSVLQARHILEHSRVADIAAAGIALADTAAAIGRAAVRVGTRSHEAENCAPVGQLPHIHNCQELPLWPH